MILYISSQMSLRAAWARSLSSDFFHHFLLRNIPSLHEHFIPLTIFFFSFLFPVFSFGFPAFLLASPPLFFSVTSFAQLEESEKSVSSQEGFTLPRNRFYGPAWNATTGLPMMHY